MGSCRPVLETHGVMLYTFLEEKGLSAIGGRQSDVGISGYLLGGGMPAFPNLHGLAG